MGDGLREQRHILDALSCGAILCAADGAVEHINPAATLILGIDDVKGGGFRVWCGDDPDLNPADALPGAGEIRQSLSCSVGRDDWKMSLKCDGCALPVAPGQTPHVILTIDDSGDGVGASDTEALLDCVRGFISDSTFEQTARRIFDHARTATGATSGYVALLDESGGNNDVLFLDSGGCPCTVDPDLPMPVRGLRATAYRDQRVVYDNAFASGEHARLMPPGHMTLENVLFAPLVVDGRALGVIGLANAPGGFTPRSASAAGTFGEMAAVALKRARDLDELGESRSRLQSLWNVASMADASVQELSTKTLAEIQQMTGSEYCFFGLLTPDETALVSHAWSTEAMAACEVQDRPVKFPIHGAGIWAESARTCRTVIVNDYSSPHPAKTGLPEGHVQITRLLTVPVIVSERVVAVAACVNKPTDYTQDDARAVQAFCSSVYAIIARREAQDEQAELHDRLRQAEKLSAVGQLAGGVAHDFNNQLSAVLGYADMLADVLTDDRLRGYATRIKRAAENATDLVGKLLAFSRKGKNLSTPVDIHEVIGEVVAILNRVLDKGITIVTRLKAEGCVTRGDPAQLQNAVLNVCINAGDAMEGGGTLTIETALAEVGPSADFSRGFDPAEGAHIRIDISDTGCGMDEGTIERIFEPFFTTKDVGRGTGMGLASAYGTVQSHRGAISVASEIGGGSSFSIFLPLDTNAAARSPADTDVFPAVSKARILLVDDEEGVRQLATDMLAGLGYRVTTCCDGQEALQVYEKSWRDIELVLLDMVMPRCSGEETFEMMKRVNPDVRTILMSGYDVNEKAQRILDRGVLDFLPKPFVLHELSRKVAGALKCGRA